MIINNSTVAFSSEFIPIIITTEAIIIEIIGSNARTRIVGDAGSFLAFPNIFMTRRRTTKYNSRPIIDNAINNDKLLR